MLLILCDALCNQLDRAELDLCHHPPLFGRTSPSQSHSSLAISSLYHGQSSHAALPQPPIPVQLGVHPPVTARTNVSSLRSSTQPAPRPSAKHPPSTKHKHKHKHPASNTPKTPPSPPKPASRNRTDCTLLYLYTSAYLLLHFRNTIARSIALVSVRLSSCPPVLLSRSVQSSPAKPSQVVS